MALLLDDGRRGHYRQVSALADCLSVRQWRLPAVVRPPWRTFAPYRLAAGLAAHPAIRQALPDREPAAIIACGRSSALVSRWLQVYWQGRPKTVQILHSGIGPKHFTWVIAPNHDKIGGDNVIHVNGSLTPVAASQLEFSGSSHASRCCLLLLGGPARHFRFTRGWLAESLSRLARQLHSLSASLQVLTSPRSPPWVAEVLAGSVHGVPCQLSQWSAMPAEVAQAAYTRAVREASLVVASADSVNLVSEAGASGKPAFVLGAERVSGRVASGVRSLLQQGYVLDVDALQRAVVENRGTRLLDETRRVAGLLLRSGLLDAAADNFRK